MLFLLVFYLQGVRGFDPVTAGILLAPARGRAARAVADQRRARRPVRLADAGDAGHGRDRRRPRRAALTIAVDTPIWQLAVWQLIVGAGSGLFASPNTSAVMGVVPPDKRGVGVGHARRC